MAGVDVGGGGKGGRKSLDSEINMIPMIDLLMVTISFLLITAVWTQIAGLQVASSGGPPDQQKQETTIDVKLLLTEKGYSRDRRGRLDLGVRRIRYAAEYDGLEWHGSDEQARGVYDEAHARGLRIPQDLSVVGFDDVEVCEWMSPRLTTVRQPLDQMAALAIRTVLQNPPSGDTPTRIELATTLVVRDSTAPPSAAADAVAAGPVRDSATDA